MSMISKHTWYVCVCVLCVVLHLEVFQPDLKVHRGDVVMFYLMLLSSTAGLYHISHRDTWSETQGVHSSLCLCKHCTLCLCVLKSECI